MLLLVATPVGNLGDLTPRALEALRTAELIVCEDTRRTRALCTHFGIERPVLVSYRQGNEAPVGRRVLDAVRADRQVVVCSDGGYPGISDPGYRLVEQAAREGLTFSVLPGASAVPLALLLSGLPSSSYTFKGFPPRKPGPRLRFFADDADRPHTLVIFESPHRIAPTLRSALEALGDRRAAVCLEMTKRFERVERGFLSDLIASFASPPRGECTIVIAGDPPALRRQPQALTASPPGRDRADP